ncbi:MAG: sensor histidine kinase [Lachnospiraceae bacterium]|nr:sensor histidine kinase [Lachnospiraceae bacterium]
MNTDIMIFVLSLLATVLAAVVLYQQLVFRTGTQKKLREMHQRLKGILDENSGERVMVFTENKELMELAAQINRLLEKNAKVEADFRRSEISSRKMLSNISHDMKTPMTVIRGYLEIMRTKGAAEPEMLEKAERKAQALMELVDSFFSLAKLEAGDTDMEISGLDACEVCRESVLDFYESLTKEDFQVDIGLPDGPVFVQGNREALQRVLSNLLSNVIRYGSEGKYLGLFLRTDERSAYIDVADRGKGIDSAFADSVFERLFTMEDSRSRSVQGNGLGLTIAKRLAEQMGGQLTLESVPHVKTVFTVTLKRALQETWLR